MQTIRLVQSLQILFFQDLEVFKLVNYRENVSTKKSSYQSWTLLILVESIVYFLMFIFQAVKLFIEFYSSHEFIHNLDSTSSLLSQNLIIHVEVYFQVWYSLFIDYFAFHFYVPLNSKYYLFDPFLICWPKHLLSSFRFIFQFHS